MKIRERINTWQLLTTPWPSPEQESMASGQLILVYTLIFCGMEYPFGQSQPPVLAMLPKGFLSRICSLSERRKVKSPGSAKTQASTHPKFKRQPVLRREFILSQPKAGHMWTVLGTLQLNRVPGDSWESGESAQILTLCQPRAEKHLFVSAAWGSLSVTSWPLMCSPGNQKSEL